MESKRYTTLRRQRTNWGMKGQRLSAEVVAIDTWHDAKWRQRQFAFIQMTVPLFLSALKLKKQGNEERMYNIFIYFLSFFLIYFFTNFTMD